MDNITAVLEKMLGPGPFLEFLAHVGTFAGAISGVRLASAKHFDWFGAYVIGFVTTLGGGTLRDMLMQKSPFWMEDPMYLITTFLAVIAIAVFGRRFISEQVTWFIFDTIAISIFMVIGIEKVIEAERIAALSAGVEYTLSLKLSCWWKSIIMGVLTAVFGGVLRDICINEVPLIFRKEIYALACAFGGVLYFLLLAFGVDARICSVTCIISIFLIRAVSIKYKLGVPVLTGRRAIHLPHIHHHHKSHHAGGKTHEDAKH